ncbi:MAG TPA: histidinol-phosphate transaminase, partial [Candidatus Saccharimonadales bacterium]
MFKVTNIIQPQICDLNPYKPGMPIETLARNYGLDPANIIKLASNENPDGMSPAAHEAAQHALLDVHRYPDGFPLRQALASHYGIPESMITIGNGSNDVLDLIARVFLGKGTEAISSQYAFCVYNIVTKITGAKNVIVPALDYGHDLDAMQAAVTDATRVVWIANPNNPTGTHVGYEALERFIENLPEHVIIALDEAYYEYLSDDVIVDTVQWLKRYPQLIIIRTFSKAYGLAGLRVGYGLASTEITDLLNRVRQPFNASHVAIIAATAALADQSFVTQSYERNMAGVNQITTGLDELGLEYIPTSGNFVTVKFA